MKYATKLSLWKKLFHILKSPEGDNYPSPKQQSYQAKIPPPTTSTEAQANNFTVESYSLN